MTKSIEKNPTPEEQELAGKLQELSDLESKLTEKELDLATISAELQALESRYIRVVGRRFAELDQLNAEIATLLAAQEPEDLQAQSEAQEAREKAKETTWEVGEDTEPRKVESFKPTQEIKDLYRKLAKKIHPDLGIDEKDRERRTKIMAEVNKAYKEGDIERLEAILTERETSPEAIEGEDVGSRLVRTIRMIARVRNRIAIISKEIQQLMETDLYELKQKYDDSAKSGMDLFEEMATSLDDQIIALRSRLKELRTQANE